jgi:hypothetical protein
MACGLIIASLLLIGIAIWIQIYSLIGVAAFIILLCVLIFVGNKKEQEYLYLPFLFCAVSVQFTSRNPSLAIPPCRVKSQPQGVRTRG